MSGFLIPFSAILVSFYVHCQRWYKMVDGRSDVRRMIQVKNIHYKLQYAFAIFSGLLLALLVHIVAPARLSGLNSLGFMLADYSNIVSSGIVLVSDLVKGIFGKELKST
uniref:DUF7087 domain-containing protein n=1 Tax=Acrobeloides nanus TaxID=290746 RepID=A0A914DI47_9BILA